LKGWANVSGANSGFPQKKTARLTLGGKNFIFQGLSTFGSVLGIGCGFFGFGFLLGFFRVLDSVLFVGFFGLYFGFQRFRILVFLGVDLLVFLGSGSLSLLIQR
jgi:hypothetical protein